MLSAAMFRPRSNIRSTFNDSLPPSCLWHIQTLVFRHIPCLAHPYEFHPISSPAFHIPNPPIAPPPVPFCAASPCIFSLTFRLTSKNLLTHRSRHTLSPLLRSASRYSGGMHFLVQDCDSLFHWRKKHSVRKSSSCKGRRFLSKPIEHV